MAAITASLVKELREKTGAGMMDCKKALTEVNGDVEAAVDWLRKKGLASAAKKAGRVAAEGLVGVTNSGKTGAVVEINSETDFVGRNEKFQAFVQDIATMMMESGGSFDSLADKPYNDTGRNVSEEITNLVATIGENMSMRRGETVSVTNGVVTSYVHSAVEPNLGRIGVLVALESTADEEKLQAFGKQLAMHVAAANPQALTAADLSDDVVARERAILTDKARASGKPEAVIEKMVEGGIQKFYKEAAFLDQAYVMDGKTKVSQVVEDMAKELGAPISITGFVRYALGEGIEKEETDFAQEVAAQVGS